MNTRSILGASALLLSLLAAPALAQRTPDVRLNTNPAGGASCVHPRVVAAGDSVHCVWEDSRSGKTDIYFTHSTDRGATWQAADTRLDVGTPQGNSVAPDICVAGSAVYVVWEDHRTPSPSLGDIWFNRSLDGGATWLPDDVRLDVGSAAGAADSRSPKVCCSGSSVYVAWYDTRNGSYDVYFNRSLDGGTTWLASDERLDTGDAPGAHTSWQVQIACQGSNVYAVWSEDRAGTVDYDIYLNRSTDGGTSWLANAVRLDTAAAGGSSENPKIVTDGSSVHVVWEDGRNGLKDVYAIRSTDGGTTWIGETRLDRGQPPGGSGSTMPSICVSGSAVYVVWQDYRTFINPQVFLNRSLDGGATWLAGDLLVNQGTESCFSFNPQIACSGNAVCVVWESQSCGGGNRPDIYCARSTDRGATWLPFDVQLDRNGFGTAGSAWPAVCFGGDQAYVVWTDYRNNTQGQSDTYWNVPFALMPYGNATPGTGGIAPQLAGNGSATLGSTVTLDASLGLPGAPGALLIGATKTATPLLGGTLLVLPVLSVPIALTGAGTLSIPLALPAATGYVGANLDFQEVFLDAGAPGGVSMSNAVELWIG